MPFFTMNAERLTTNTKTQPATCHTSLPVEVVLSADAQSTLPGSGDPRFTCILCREGANKNGDHFTAEELASRAVTAVNKKIDLKHSQDVTDIVGNTYCLHLRKYKGGEFQGQPVYEILHGVTWRKSIRQGIPVTAA